MQRGSAGVLARNLECAGLDGASDLRDNAGDSAAAHSGKASPYRNVLFRSGDGEPRPSLGHDARKANGFRYSWVIVIRPAGVAFDSSRQKIFFPPCN